MTKTMCRCLVKLAYTLIVCRYVYDINNVQCLVKLAYTLIVCRYVYDKACPCGWMVHYSIYRADLLYVTDWSTFNIFTNILITQTKPYYNLFWTNNAKMWIRKQIMFKFVLVSNKCIWFIMFIRVIVADAVVFVANTVLYFTM